jgi:predicted acyltransferase
MGIFEFDIFSNLIHGIFMDKLQPLANQRLLSLDAFRGFTIALMIVVNDPGSWQHVYAPLLHAKWHGITPTDLVFPFFLFIVGVSIVLAFSKRLEKGTEKKSLYKKILIRSLKIFAVGIFLALFPSFDFSNLRIAGVLQRIAVVFLVCSFLFLHFAWKKLAFIGAATLVAYWLIMAFVPVPGLGYPSLEPGKNIAACIDSVLLPGRLYRGTWDPEGILSTFPSIATGITGMLAGILIAGKSSLDRKIIWLFVIGFICFVLGGMWNWFFPINKNLWTSSFVLYTSGAAALTLATCMFIADVLNLNSWTRMGRVFGANAITVYVFAGVLPDLLSGVPIFGITFNDFFMQSLTGLGLEPKLVSLLYAILFALICYIPAYILYKRKIFIKL